MHEEKECCAAAAAAISSPSSCRSSFLDKLFFPLLFIRVFYIQLSTRVLFFHTSFLDLGFFLLRLLWRTENSLRLVVFIIQHSSLVTFFTFFRSQLVISSNCCSVLSSGVFSLMLSVPDFSVTTGIVQLASSFRVKCD